MEKMKPISDSHDKHVSTFDSIYHIVSEYKQFIIGVSVGGIGGISLTILTAMAASMYGISLSSLRWKK